MPHQVGDPRGSGHQDRPPLVATMRRHKSTSSEYSLNDSSKPPISRHRAASTIMKAPDSTATGPENPSSRRRELPRRTPGRTRRLPWRTNDGITWQLPDRPARPAGRARRPRPPPRGASWQTPSACRSRHPGAAYPDQEQQVLAPGASRRGIVARAETQIAVVVDPPHLRDLPATGISSPVIRVVDHQHFEGKPRRVILDALQAVQNQRLGPIPHDDDRDLGAGRRAIPVHTTG